MVVVAPVLPIVPAPEIDLPAASVTSCVPPPKFSAAPAAAEKLPVLVPPVLRLNVPVEIVTAPVLLNGTLLYELPVAVDLVKVPELLKALVPPKFSVPLSVVVVKLPLLVNVPLLKSSRPAVQLPVPLSVIRRCT